MTTTRRCGDCQLCCRLLPTAEIDKPANARCPHQKHGVGCAIYASRPVSCRLWSCRWLVGKDTADLPRPDRAHYVIDCIPDLITVGNKETGERRQMGALQVWVDPQHRDAHRAPSFRRWLERQGMPAIIRYSNVEAFVLLPPSMTEGHGFVEQQSSAMTAPTTLKQKAEALGGHVHVEHIDENGIAKAVLMIDGVAIEVAADFKLEIS